VNTKDGPTKLVRQDAILGGLSIGQFLMSVTLGLGLGLGLNNDRSCGRNKNPDHTAKTSRVNTYDEEGHFIKLKKGSWRAQSRRRQKDNFDNELVSYRKNIGNLYS